MIVHQVEHNSPEWTRLRLGIPCSSEFHRIVTAGGKDGKNPKVSSKADAYLYRLLAEYFLGEPVENYESEYMVRGHELEDAAVEAYEFLKDIPTERAGFITTDDGMIGTSPDRLVGKDRLLEIKCPLSQNQIDYLLSGQLEPEYRVQLMGQLLVTERQGVDIFSYHPRLPGKLISIERDEDFIKILSACLSTFVEMLLIKREELTQRYGLKPPEPPKEQDLSRYELSESDGEDIVRAIFPESML